MTLPPGLGRRPGVSGGVFETPSGLGWCVVAVPFVGVEGRGVKVQCVSCHRGDAQAVC